MPQGGHFHKELEPALDRAAFEAGNRVPFDWTGWTGRADIVNEQNVTIVTFTTGGVTGMITMDNAGAINFDLVSDLIDDMAATVEVAGVIHAPLYGTFIVTSPDGDPYVVADVTLEIPRRTGS